jgi:hypothetical protein
LQLVAQSENSAGLIIDLSQIIPVPSEFHYMLSQEDVTMRHHKSSAFFLIVILVMEL